MDFLQFSPSHRPHKGGLQRAVRVDPPLSLMAQALEFSERYCLVFQMGILLQLLTQFLPLLS